MTENLARAVRAAVAWRRDPADAHLDEATGLFLSLVRAKREAGAAGPAQPTDPVHYLAACHLGELMIRHGSFGRALSMLHECVGLAAPAASDADGQLCVGATCFEDDVDLRHLEHQVQLGMLLVRFGRAAEAIPQLRQALRRLDDPLARWAAEGESEVLGRAAAAFLGLALKIGQQYDKATPLLERGSLLPLPPLTEGECGDVDPWWTKADLREIFINWGDALARQGQATDAATVYQQATQRHLFVSPHQRPVHFTPNLTARPVWFAHPQHHTTAQDPMVQDPTQATGASVQDLMGQDPTHATDASASLPPALRGVIEVLENNWEDIRNEGHKLLGWTTQDTAPASPVPSLATSFAALTGAGAPAAFTPAHSLLIHDHNKVVSWLSAKKHALPAAWTQFYLFELGLRDHKNCALAPITCSIAQRLGAEGLLVGDAKFSLMAPQTSVVPHCGPTNTRLRVHLGLSGVPRTSMTVADHHTLTWAEGKAFCFDDSFEHQVEHAGELPRLIFLMDVWHPELPPHKRPTERTTAPTSVIKNNLEKYADLAEMWQVQEQSPFMGIAQQLLGSPESTAALLLLLTVLWAALYWRFILSKQVARLRTLYAQKKEREARAKEEQQQQQQQATSTTSTSSNRSDGSSTSTDSHGRNTSRARRRARKGDSGPS